MSNLEKLLKLANGFNKKEVSAIDNGFIEDCIESNLLDLARDFLMNVYQMTLTEAIAHVGKVMQKKVEIS